MTQPTKASFKDKTKKSVNEIRLELKRVVWPTKKQLIGYTITVVMACIIIGAIIAAFDALWTNFLLKPLTKS